MQILHNLGVRLRWLVFVGVRQLENNWSSRWALATDGSGIRLACLPHAERLALNGLEVRCPGPRSCPSCGVLVSVCDPDG